MEKHKINLLKNVKFINPVSEAEGRLIFKITNYNNITRRVYIELLNTNLPFPPQQLVSIDDIENTDEQENFYT